MKRFNNFLESHLYLLVISVGAFVGWFIKFDLTILNTSISINELFIIGYLFWGLIILTFVEDTKHLILVYISTLLMFNSKDLGLEYLNGFNAIYVMVALLIIGVIIHLIRFKPKLKWGTMSIGFGLLALSYFLPFIYSEIKFSLTALAISFVGVIYLIFYWFFKSTSTTKTNDLLTYLFFASITIMLQIYSVVIYNYLTMSGIPFLEKMEKGLNSHWGNSNFGYGNINDVIIFFTITFAGQIYFLHKYRHRIFIWIFPILSIYATYLSGSRGGWLSWLILCLIVYFFFLIKGNRQQRILVNLTLVLAFIPFMINPGLFNVVIARLKLNSDNLNQFTSGRITLYKQALEIFKEFPLFGAGWSYQLEANNDNRIQIFHSTIFQTLAISGIFGLISLIIYLLTSIFLFIRKMSFAVAVLLFSWLATMIHGLFDNTVHMLIYTILCIFILVAVENEATTKPQYSLKKIVYRKDEKNQLNLFQ